jgi:hypothetical protein
MLICSSAWMPKPVGIGPMPTRPVIEVSAGRATGGEHLFRVGARAAGAAEFARGGELDVQDAVGGHGAAVAAAGGGGFGGVEDLIEGHGVFLSG